VNRPPVVIVGLGSPILSDDAVGLHVADRVRQLLAREPVDVRQAAVGGLGLLEEIAGYEAALLVDASLAGLPPGTTRRLHLAEARHLQRLSYQHGISFEEAINVGRQCGMRVADPIIIYAIEVADAYTFSEELTPPVEAVVEGVAIRVASEARHLATQCRKAEGAGCLSAHARVGTNPCTNPA